MSNLENCQKSGNMQEGELRAKDLLASKASGKKGEKQILKAKKTGNSIRKTKSKAQAGSQNKTLVGIKTFFNDKADKKEENTPQKEPEAQTNGEDRPVKQEFIIKPYQPEDQQKTTEGENEVATHTSIQQNDVEGCSN